MRLRSNFIAQESDKRFGKRKWQVRNVNATQRNADVVVELSTLYFYFCDFASYSKRTAYSNSNALHTQTPTHCIPKLKRIAYTQTQTYCVPNTNALHTQTQTYCIPKRKRIAKRKGIDGVLA